MKSRDVLVLAALVGAVSLPLRADDSTPTYNQVIEVRAVNVEAVVTGRSGDRLTGLSPQDFELLVDGQPVPLDFFAEVADGQVRPGALAGGDQPADAPARSLMIFLDDSLSLGVDRDLVLKRLAQDLTQLAPADQVAVVSFDGQRVTRQLDWTTDRALLAVALQAASERRADGIRTVVGRRLLEENLAFIYDALYDREYQYLDHSEAFGRLLAVRGLAGVLKVTPENLDRFGRVPYAAASAMRTLEAPTGRRLMLLVSGGWPFEVLGAPLALEANRLGYSVYPVDVAGIDTTFTAADVGQTVAGARGRAGDGFERGVEASFAVLAEATGGQVALNSNRLAALSRVVTDTQQYYWLSFSPAWKEDDTPHKIEISVKRPGAKVRFREGFSDLSPATRTQLADLDKRYNAP